MTKAIRVSENFTDTEVEEIIFNWAEDTEQDLVVVRGEHEVVYDETEN
jgi:hypothetical protein